MDVKKGNDDFGTHSTQQMLHNYDQIRLILLTYFNEDFMISYDYHFSDCLDKFTFEIRLFLTFETLSAYLPMSRGQL